MSRAGERAPDAPIGLWASTLDDQTNLALSRNARLGLWIHVSNAVYEKGQGSVERDLAIVAEPAARPVAHVLHTAIHRLPAPAR